MSRKEQLSRFAAKERVSYLTSWSCSLMSFWRRFCISTVAIVINETNAGGWLKLLVWLTASHNLAKCTLAWFSPHSKELEKNKTKQKKKLFPYYLIIILQIIFFLFSNYATCACKEARLLLTWQCAELTVEWATCYCHKHEHYLQVARFEHS